MKMSEGIYKYLDCSTAHITPEDDRRLKIEATHDGPLVYRTDYGYWVIVLEDIHDNDEATLLRKQGYSEAFVVLLKLCHLHGVQWIKLDADGNVYEDLEKFDW